MKDDRKKRYTSDGSELNSNISSNPFFKGQEAKDRMTLIRSSIKTIREKWSCESYDELVSLTEEVFDKNGNIKKFIEEISKRRNWCDVYTEGFQTTNDNYVIRKYTTTRWHRRIFKKMNLIFEGKDDKKDIANDAKKIIAATFVNELINIDLYNYINHKKDKAGFKGVVYRGLTLNKKGLDFFKKIIDSHDSPLNERDIAIPLSIYSSSRSDSIAKEFSKPNKNSKSGKTNAVLLKVDVIKLDDDLLKQYKEKYPKGIVTSLCAVHIKDISAYKREDEVLLRGAFFRVLDCYEDHTLLVSGKPLNVIEVVMLNTNRDHLNTMLDFKGKEDEAKEAGALMNNLVAKQKARYCVKYYENKGNDGMKKRYEEEL